MTQSTEYLLGYSAGTATCMYIFRAIYAMLQEKKHGSNGKVHTFAQDPDRYWDAMRQNVTKPLSDVLDRQTRILEDQAKGNRDVMLKLVQLEERTRRP